jgi:hypothetical protein
LVDQSGASTIATVVLNLRGVAIGTATVSSIGVFSFVKS